MKQYWRIVVMDTKSMYDDILALRKARNRWKERAAALLLLTCAVLTGAFWLDGSVRTWLLTAHNSALDILGNVGHWFGGGQPTAWLFFCLYFGGLLLGLVTIRKWGLLIGKSYLLSGLITNAVKFLVGRWRPFTDHGSLTFTPLSAGPNAHLSFPSGHVTVAFALAVVMASMNRNWVWRILWIALASITAFSRMYHDQHWLSDVIFSISNGTAVSIWLVKRYQAASVPANDVEALQ